MPLSNNFSTVRSSIFWCLSLFSSIRFRWGWKCIFSLKLGSARGHTFQESFIRGTSARKRGRTQRLSWEVSFRIPARKVDGRLPGRASKMAPKTSPPSLHREESCRNKKRDFYTPASLPAGPTHLERRHLLKLVEKMFVISSNGPAANLARVERGVDSYRKWLENHDERTGNVWKILQTSQSA